MRKGEEVTLPNAPIHEAVLEILVELPEAGREPLLGKLQREFVEFSISRELVQLQVDATTTEPHAERDVKGVLLEANDKKTVVHARLDGFAVSRLKPYLDWNTFCGEAVQLWERYCRITQPLKCVRLGLRYINHLEMDLARGLADTLKFNFSVPVSLAPVGLTEMMTMFTSEFPEEKATARVALHIPPVQAGGTKVQSIFDIDVYRTIDIAPDDPGLWQEFELLRKVKNEIFFGSITAEARRRYEV
jgi:uncharacterized protein (TIGR04255 family)